MLDSDEQINWRASTWPQAVKNRSHVSLASRVVLFDGHLIAGIVAFAEIV